MMNDQIIDFDESHVEGELVIPGHVSTAPGGKVEYNTLDEPIRDTIVRDARAVGLKFRHVLIPKEKKSLLQDWDLWGPLILCTFMAMILQISADSPNEGGPEFAEVFVIVWVGAAVVTLNSKLLGGTLSFFQSVCVLGYCLLPPVLALVFCQMVLLFKQTNIFFAFRLIATSIGFGWATYAATKFLGDSQPREKKILAVYPIFLFYFVISWLVISHTHPLL